MSENVYQIITNQIIEKLEAGVAPWRKEWGSTSVLGANQSLVSRKPYRGVNALITACAGFDSPYWLTFKQAKEMGGSVRKGEVGTKVCYLGQAEKKDQATGEESSYSFLRYYTVFNVEQCDGIEYPKPEKVQGPEFNPIAACEQLVLDTQLRSVIRHAGGQAFYSPRLDSITMPVREAFRSPEGYYATLFHEMGHATGHESRLDRGLDAPAAFGTPDYSKEELVAEMAAAFLCAETGIAPATLDNSAAYLSGWIKVLKGDSRLIVSASAQGQKAADYILNRMTIPATL